MNSSKSIENALADELLQRFVTIGLAQYDAAFVIDTARYSRLYASMNIVRNELQRRPGDQRRVLRPLLAHPNMQVRMMAANTLLALFPADARKALESVRDSNIDPQNGDAAGTLRALNDGSFVPK